VREVCPHPLRAQRLERQSRHRLRQIHHGLHLPLARPALLHRPAANAIREPAPAANHAADSRSDRRPKRLDGSKWSPGVLARNAARNRQPPRRRRPRRNHRPRRRPHLLLLRLHHDPQRKLLPLRKLRQHQRLQLALCSADIPVREM